MNNDQVIYPEPDTVSQNEPVTDHHELEEHYEDVTERHELPEEAIDIPVEESSENTGNRTVSSETKAERNWREMRERTQRIERERDEAIGLLKKIEEEALRYQQQAQYPQQQEKSILDIDDDEIVEGRHLKQLVKNELESMKKNMSSYRQQHEESLVERQIKEQYNDWDSVVNHDTVKKLNEEYPDIAYSLSLNPDLKKKATSTYTIMKKLGIAGDIPVDYNQRKAQENLSKPRSSQAAAPQSGSTPLNKANAFAQGMSDSDLKRLYEEMIASANSQ